MLGGRTVQLVHVFGFNYCIANNVTFAELKLIDCWIFAAGHSTKGYWKSGSKASFLFRYMNITPAQVNTLLRKRRSIFPKTYTGKPISREIVEEILENANWAPTHKLTEPWRFKVIVGGGLERLSGFLSSHYKSNTPSEKFSEIKYNKLKANPMKAACIIAVCMVRDPQERLPEWEEVAATACAVQNMYLTCTAHGIGCYWSTPRAALEANAFLGLEDGERCLGLFYMGYHNMPEVPRKRNPVEDKTTWITS